MVFGNEALELPSDREPARHLSRVEPVRLSYRHRRKDIIGQSINHPAHAERRPRDRVPVVEICTSAVHRTDIKAEIKLQLLLRIAGTAEKERRGMRRRIEGRLSVFKWSHHNIQ